MPSSPASIPVSSPSSTLSNSGTSSNQNSLALHAICIGTGIDTSSAGILASLVLATVIGLGLWVCCHEQPLTRNSHSASIAFVRHHTTTPQENLCSQRMVCSATVSQILSYFFHHIHSFACQPSSPTVRTLRLCFPLPSHASVPADSLRRLRCRTFHSNRRGTFPFR